MTTKRKTTSNNVLSSLWQEALFTREFAYETDAAPDAVVQALSALTKKPEESVEVNPTEEPLQVQFIFQKDDHGHIQFRIVSNLRTGDDGDAAEGRGLIRRDDENNLTYIEGKVYYTSQIQMALAVAFILVILGSFVILEPPLSYIAVVALIIPIYAFVGLPAYRDRNRILQRMDRAILSDEESDNSTQGSQAQNAPSAYHHDDLSDQELQANN